MRSVDLTFDLAGSTPHLRHQWARFRRQAVSERGADLVDATLAPLGAERTRLTLELDPGAAQILSAGAARSVLGEVQEGFLDFLEDEGFRAANEGRRFTAADAAPIGPSPDSIRFGPYLAIAAFALIAVMLVPKWQEARESAGTQASSPEAVRAFLSFARAQDPEAPALHDGRASEGLRHLAAAISETRRGGPWPDRARRLEEAAARVSPAREAALVRAVFIEAAGWIGEGAAAPIREELSAAARAVDARRLLSEQGAAIERYFDAAARAMSAAAEPGMRVG